MCFAENVRDKQKISSLISNLRKTDYGNSDRSFNYFNGGSALSVFLVGRALPLPGYAEALRRGELGAAGYRP
jgi:hypothetical protein